MEHNKWIPVDPNDISPWFKLYQCSVCKCMILSDAHNEEELPDKCPWCESDMRS